MLLNNHECKLGWTLITFSCYVIFYSCIIPRPNMLFAYGENLYQLPSKRLEPSRYASFINLHWHVISFYIHKNLQIFYGNICVVDIKIVKYQDSTYKVTYCHITYPVTHYNIASMIYISDQTLLNFLT